MSNITTPHFLEIVFPHATSTVKNTGSWLRHSQKSTRMYLIIHLSDPNKMTQKLEQGTLKFSRIPHGCEANNWGMWNEAW